MAEYGVIADDLTGANATGVLLTRLGLPAATMFGRGPVPAELDVLVLSTASRALPRETAYRLVYDAALGLKGQGVANWSKRIDSTVRGNLGPEVDALLDVVGSDYIAVVTPAFPASGRVVAGGYLLVHGVPVSETAAGRDVAAPVHESHVPTLMAAQSKYQVGYIGLGAVLKGPDAVKEQVVRQVREGRRVFVADSTTDEHLSVLVEGLENAKIPYFPADPGPFTAAVFAYRAGRPGKPPGSAAKLGPRQRPVLLVSGSVTPLTFEQLSYLESKFTTAFVEFPPRQADPEAAAAELESRISGETEVAVLCSARSSGQVLKGVTPEELETIAARLGQAAAALLSRRPFAGLVTTGGDVTVGVLRALGAHGIELVTEVLPLAARGRILGGAASGLDIVTKGGLVGDRAGLYLCCRHILEGEIPNESK